MRYVRQKLIQLVIVVIAVTFLTFISINLLPGDPAIFKAGPGATTRRSSKSDTTSGSTSRSPSNTASG